MRNIFIAIFLVLALGMSYLLYEMIKDPIAFDNDRKEYIEAVKQRLVDIRSAQEMYQDVTGKYAHSFDTLEEVLRTDTFTRIKVSGDPDDPRGEAVIYDTVRTEAVYDSVVALGIDLEEMRYVPFSDYDGERDTFDLTAKIIDYENTRQPVVQVGTRYETFMGRYDASYKRYDSRYDPNAVIRFGDLTKPSVSGSWD